MDSKDTIFALTTPFGKSGVAVIRVSGSNALEAARILTQHQDFEPRYCALLDIFDANCNKIDKGLVIYFNAPHSFTGEDVVEFQVHGSIAVIKAIMHSLAMVPGLRLAEAGEFAKTAFLNNKLDLTRAEALEDLINAETSLQLKQAMNQLDGKFHDFIWEWRDQIIQIIAYVESYIDFPDEDIPHDIEMQIHEKIQSLLAQIQEYLDDKQIGQKIKSGIYISISGKPNVGKSSLINYFAGRDIAIVSQIAGTTRDVIETTIDIEGIPIIFADTAGLREAEDEIEKIGINRAKDVIQKSDLKLKIFSIDDDLHNIGCADDEIIVVNKIDLSQERCNKLKELSAIFISLKTLEGLEALQDAIKEKLSYLNTPSKVPFITRDRYRLHLAQAVLFLAHFLSNKDIVLAAEDLRLAKREFEKISGSIDVDEILDVVFSSFCIGK
jgi:tRNA modification GTPase